MFRRRMLCPFQLLVSLKSHVQSIFLFILLAINAPEKVSSMRAKTRALTVKIKLVLDQRLLKTEVMFQIKNVKVNVVTAVVVCIL